MTESPTDRRTARNRRNEGIVLKDPESPYSPGNRGQMWLKLKTHLPTLDCVVTAAEYGHGKRRESLSDYTFAVWDRDPYTVPTAALKDMRAELTLVKGRPVFRAPGFSGAR